LGVVLGEESEYSTYVALFSLGYIVLQYSIDQIFFRGKEGVVSGVLILCSLGLCMGIVRAQFVLSPHVFSCENGCTLRGTVVHSRENIHDTQSLVIRPDLGDNNSANVLVRVPLYPVYEYGDLLDITGVITEPKKILPHSDKKYFDYGAYLLTKDIGSTALYPRVEKVGSENSFVRTLILFRERLVSKITEYMSQPASLLASGMVFGSASLSDSMKDTFRIAGLSHIIVLSGFNVAVLISFTLLVLRFLPLYLRAIAASSITILFILMVEGEVSVVRATLMSFIALLALTLGRGYVAKQALIISLFCIVMYHPYSLVHDVSLHLSFLATAGIVYGVPYVSFLTKKIFRGRHYIFLEEVIYTSVAAYCATLPYLMYTFGSISLYALIANLLVIPIVPIAMIATCITALSAYIASPLGLFLGVLASWIHVYIISIAKIVALLPFATITVSVSFLEMIIIYAVLGVGLCSFSKKIRISNGFTEQLSVPTDNETQKTNDRDRNSIIVDTVPY
jgi:competence protein ComEC